MYTCSGCGRTVWSIEPSCPHCGAGFSNYDYELTKKWLVLGGTLGGGGCFLLGRALFSTMAPPTGGILMLALIVAGIVLGAIGGWYLQCKKGLV